MKQYQFFSLLGMLENVLYNLNHNPLYLFLGILCVGIVLVLVIKGE